MKIKKIAAEELSDAGTGKEQIARIMQMEKYLDELTEILHTAPERFFEDAEIIRKLQELTDYYENGQWMRDYEADEKGKLPKELKRGVLSEDAVYDLLFEIEQYKNTSTSEM